MADHQKKAGPVAPADPVGSEAALAEKLRHIDARLSQIRAGQDERQQPGGRLMSDGSAMARGMKLVSEFVAGIVAGGVLGWLLDRFAGITPFGLLIGLMFGFAAGLRNLYRATQGQSVLPPGPRAGPPGKAGER